MSSEQQPSSVENTMEDWEARYVELSMAHEQVKGQLFACQVQGVASREIEANWAEKLKVARNENSYLRKLKEELMDTLEDVRLKNTEMFHKLQKVEKEAKEHAEQLEKIDALRQEIEALGTDATSSMSIFEFIKDLSDKIRQIELERRERLEEYKKNSELLIKEMTSIKSQKEDIINHSNNSEKAYQERISELTERLQKTSVKDKECKLEKKNIEMKKKLDNALEAIADLEEVNSSLREELEDYSDKVVKLEVEREFQKKFQEEDADNNAKNIEKFEDQIAMLNNRMAGLEIELKEAVEKQVKMRISFANDKANFCHDMERVEEKWNTECVNLKDANERLKTSLADANEHVKQLEEDLEKTREYTSFKIQELLESHAEKGESDRDKIEALNAQLNDAEKSHLEAVKDWDDECEELEDEIYNLMFKRKTEKKKLRTLKKKNNWLVASIRNLATRRREERDAMLVEKYKYKTRCENLQKEKEAWLEELKESNKQLEESNGQVQKYRQAQISLMREHEEMAQKTDELEQMRNLWKEEHEKAVKQIHELKAADRVTRRTLEDKIRSVGISGENRLASLHQIWQKELENAVKDHKSKQEAYEKEIADYKEELATTRKNLELAEDQYIMVTGEYEKLTKGIIQENRAHNQEMRQMAALNKELSENMGVQTIDDSSSSSPELDDDDLLYEEADRERELKKKKQQEEWELVDDEAAL